jgi:hypothetical protein
MLTLDKIAELIDEFKRIPRVAPVRTFMEVADYPHYENVCSNILAFYLDPTLEHKMGDLLLRALMERLKINWNGEISRADITREEPSPGGGRLDLLIITDDFVIGIENKIKAPLYNIICGARRISCVSFPSILQLMRLRATLRKHCEKSCRYLAMI